MGTKRRNAILSAALILSLLFSGCGNQTGTSSSLSTPPPAKTIEQEFEYIRAVLDNNALQITILPGECAEACFGDNSRIRYNMPYDVSQLKGTYTDMFIGVIGQDLWTYVFLLTDKGTVECVPVADIVNEAGRPFYPSDDFDLFSLGELGEVSQVVGFEQGSVMIEDSSGYSTVFALCADGTSIDLSYPILFAYEPQDAPASEAESLHMLKENEDAASRIKKGMKPVNTREIQFISGEYCRLFSLEKNEEQLRYGVGASGAIYCFNDDGQQWEPVNPLAAVYSRADTYDDLFVVITDPATPVYEQYKDTARLISTPASGLEKKAPVLILPLKQNMDIKVELMADNSEDYYAEVADTFLDETVCRTDPCLIGTTLVENGGVLRITAKWYDGFSELTGFWYATYFQGSPLYTRYIAGSYELPPDNG